MEIHARGGRHLSYNPIPPETMKAPQLTFGPRCQRCWNKFHVSQRKGIWEKVFLRTFLLKPVRCYGCGRRCYSPVFMQVLPRSAPAVAVAAPGDPGSCERLA